MKIVATVKVLNGEKIQEEYHCGSNEHSIKLTLSPAKDIVLEFISNRQFYENNEYSLTYLELKSNNHGYTEDIRCTSLAYNEKKKTELLRIETTHLMSVECYNNEIVSEEHKMSYDTSERFKYYMYLSMRPHKDTELVFSNNIISKWRKHTLDSFLKEYFFDRNFMKLQYYSVLNINDPKSLVHSIMFFTPVYPFIIVEEESNNYLSVTKEGDLYKVCISTTSPETFTFKYAE